MQSSDDKRKNIFPLLIKSEQRKTPYSFNEMKGINMQRITETETRHLVQSLAYCEQAITEFQILSHFKKDSQPLAQHPKLLDVYQKIMGVAEVDKKITNLEAERNVLHEYRNFISIQQSKDAGFLGSLKNSTEQFMPNPYSEAHLQPPYASLHSRLQIMDETANKINLINNFIFKNLDNYEGDRVATKDKIKRSILSQFEQFTSDIGFEKNKEEKYTNQIISFLEMQKSVIAQDHNSKSFFGAITQSKLTKILEQTIQDLKNKKYKEYIPLESKIPKKG